MSYTAQQAESALKPAFEKLMKAIDNESWAEVEAFYHPNGVVVQKDKEAVYGAKAVAEYMEKFAELSGKSVGTVTNAKYEGAGDYLIVHADMSMDTEKMGILKGRFLQIWKKDGEKHLVYHDEFEVLA